MTNLNITAIDVLTFDFGLDQSATVAASDIHPDVLAAALSDRLYNALLDSYAGALKAAYDAAHDVTDVDADVRKAWGENNPDAVTAKRKELFNTRLAAMVSGDYSFRSQGRAVTGLTDEETAKAKAIIGVAAMVPAIDRTLKNLKGESTANRYRAVLAAWNTLPEALRAAFDAAWAAAAQTPVK